MKKNSITGIENDLRGIPENVAKNMHALLEEKNYKEKHRAKEALLKKGSSILPHMHNLLASGNASLRREATRMIELLADKKSILPLIQLLSDPETEIRWMAAEGLIRIGRRSIEPILKAVRDNEDAFLLDKGAHHVLVCLLHRKEKEKLKPLLLSLDNYHELGETSPLEAEKALKTAFKITK